jgi:hypothetical protein
MLQGIVLDSLFVRSDSHSSRLPVGMTRLFLLAASHSDHQLHTSHIGLKNIKFSQDAGDPEECVQGGSNIRRSANDQLSHNESLVNRLLDRRLAVWWSGDIYVVRPMLVIGVHPG